MMEFVLVLVMQQFGKEDVMVFLYPRHLCRGVYSYRLDVCPFVRSYVRSFVCSFVRYFPSRS